MVRRFWGCIGIVIVLSSLAMAATPTLTLSITTGPPTSSVTVSGTAFPDSVAIDIYFDQSDLAFAVSSSTGAFSGQHPTISVRGETDFKYPPTPAMSPPPPTATNTASRPGTWRSSSSASVPCPATTSRSL